MRLLAPPPFSRRGGVIALLIRLFIVVLVCGALAWPQSGHAEDVKLRYTTSTQVLEGQSATLTVMISTGLKNVTVTLTPKKKGAKSKVLKHGSASANQELNFSWKPAGKGPQNYSAKVEATSSSGTALNWEFDFAFEVSAAMVVNVYTKKADLEQGRIYFSASQPVAEVSLQVLGEGLKVLTESKKTYKGKKGDLSIDYTPPKGEVIVRMTLKITGTNGIWVSQNLIPFSIEIPSEHVPFDSNKHNIRTDAKPVLDASLREIKDKVNRFGKDIELELYVAGYTDTVGKPDDNRKLSGRRAKAIAQYFRQNGIKIPIYYQGFGEDALAVGTPDNTDNEANRRVVYVIANMPPRGANFPHQRWKLLK